MAVVLLAVCRNDIFDVITLFSCAQISLFFPSTFLSYSIRLFISRQTSYANMKNTHDQTLKPFKSIREHLNVSLKFKLNGFHGFECLQDWLLSLLLHNLSLNLNSQIEQRPLNMQIRKWKLRFDMFCHQD